MAGLGRAFGRVASLAFLVALIACMGLVLGPVSAFAQTVTSTGASAGTGVPQNILNRLTPDQAQQLYQQSQQLPGTRLQIPPVAMPERSVLIPLTPPPQPPPQPSDLENTMSQRAGTMLTQFGYNQLANGQLVASSQVGGIQNNYVLGVGDQLDVTLQGQENSEFSVTVDRDGRVTLPKLPPIAAAGRTFGEFRKQLEDAVQKAYISTKAYVTLTTVRQVNVLVVGNVRYPGVQTLTGLSTVLDALNLAGGIEKTGTLRDIVIVRGKRIIHVDLYDFLRGDKPVPDITVAQGDRIIVPAIGPTVAVSGSVRRPGIYELAPGDKSISEAALLRLADGPVLPGTYRQMVLKIHRNGTQELVDSSNKPNAQIHDGEILFEAPAVNRATGKVTLAGPVRLPGIYPLDKVHTLHDLLPSADAFKPAPYMLMGIISRIDPQTQQRVLIPFSPAQVIAGKANKTLISNDVVQILTVPQMRVLASLANQPQGQQNQGNLPNNQYCTNAAGQTTAQAPYGSQQNATSANIYGQQQNTLQPNPYGTSGSQQNTLQSNPYGTTGSQQNATSGNYNGNIYTQTQGDNAGAFGNVFQNNAPPYANTNTNNSVYGQQQSGGQYGTGAQGSTGQGQSGTGCPPGTQAGNGAQLYGAPGMYPPGSDLQSIAGLLANLGLMPEDLVNNGYLGHVFSDYQITLSGAVRDPGPYLIAPGTTLAQVLAAAGGLDNDADTSGFELTTTKIDNRTGKSTTSRRTVHVPPTDYGNVVLHLLDNVNFHHVYTNRVAGSVMIEGQVRYPGRYSLLRGERLSDVLVRAGGLTRVAYPYGTVFLRQSLAAQERHADERLAETLDRQLVAEVTVKAGGPAGQQGLGAVSEIERFIQGVRQQPALGRMTVIADPSVLAANPQKDPMLEPGDNIYIPQLPSTVLVTGAVMQPGNYQFAPDATAEDYISQAGGYGDGAEEDMIFVVYPDGTAHKIDSSWLHFTSASIPPGSVIYVPRDLFPTNWLGLTATLTGLFQNMAVTAASFAVLSTRF